RQYEPCHRWSWSSACVQTHRLLHRLGDAEPATHHGALSLPTQFLLDVARTAPVLERGGVTGESGEPSQKQIRCAQSCERPPQWWLAPAHWGQAQSCRFRCNTTQWAGQ